MTIDEAISELHKKWVLDLNGKGDIQAVGEGQDVIHVYVKKKGVTRRLKEQMKEYQGWPVEFHYFGEIRIG
jgi:hypothetical protein